MEEFEWAQIKVECDISVLDTVSSFMSMLDSNLLIEDFSDIDDNLKPIYGELIDVTILNHDKNKSSISIFVKSDENVLSYTSFINERSNELGLDVSISITGVSEQDWYNEWKKGFEPVHIGKHLTVVPAWMEYQASEDEVTVLMDPGMAFGSGTHETTKLCASMLEKYIYPNAKILDIGTGSGILSIFALKLGASKCFGYDLDPIAVRVACENAVLNKVDGFLGGVSDLLNNVSINDSPFDIVLANIVSDIIIRMSKDISSFLRPGSLLICSGIIIDKKNDVLNSFLSKGFSLIDEAFDNDWCSLVFQFK